MGRLVDLVEFVVLMVVISVLYVGVAVLLGADADSDAYKVGGALVATLGAPLIRIWRAVDE